MFEYFYDNGKTQDDEWFVLSEDPKARVRVVFYDFESFEFLAPEFATKTLTGTQLYAGRGIKVTLPRGMAELRNGGSFASGRIYGEMQLVLQDPKKVGPLSRIIAGRSDVVETVASAPVVYDIKTYLEPFEKATGGASVLAVGIVMVLLLTAFVLYILKVYNLYQLLCPGCSSGAKLKKH